MEDSHEVGLSEETLAVDKFIVTHSLWWDTLMQGRGAWSYSNLMCQTLLKGVEGRWARGWGVKEAGGGWEGEWWLECKMILKK